MRVRLRLLGLFALLLLIGVPDAGRSSCLDCVVVYGSEEGETECVSDSWENWYNCEPIRRCYNFLGGEEHCQWYCAGSRCFRL